MRENPAREIEVFATGIVERWVGPRGVVAHIGSGHGPDFRIVYHDGRVAIGEVGWHEDPVTQEMWSATLRRQRPQIVSLPVGRGQWGVRLVRGAHIGDLHKRLPALIEALLGLGQDGIEIVGPWPRTAEADEARSLGIEHLHRMNRQEPSSAVYLLPGSGGMVPTDADVIVDWVEGTLSDPDYHDTTAKLARLQAAERHVFLVSGSRTDFGAGERLRRIGSTVPSRSPNVSPAISHVWVSSLFGSHAGVWARDSGWSIVSADAEAPDAQR